MTTSALPSAAQPLSGCSPLLVACLCADWCGTCREYKAGFQALAREFPGTEFRWVDIEDAAELVDPVEVENFPTLLIAGAQGVHFFGTVTPHLETLRRLVQTHAADSSTLQDAALQALHLRLRRS